MIRKDTASSPCCMSTWPGAAVSGRSCAANGTRDSVAQPAKTVRAASSSARTSVRPDTSRGYGVSFATSKEYPLPRPPPRHGIGYFLPQRQICGYPYVAGDLAAALMTAHGPAIRQLAPRQGQVAAQKGIASPMRDSSVPGVVRERARLQPNDVAVTFIDYEQDWDGV